ncbi:MAG: hypothetical protein R3F43_11685 [bacterium]
MHLDHVAGMVEAFLSRVEPMGFLQGSQHAGRRRRALALRVVGAGSRGCGRDAGSPRVPSRSSLRLEDLALRTEGRVDLEGCRWI